MYVYEIRIQGHLDQHWATWFDGLTISYESDGSTLLRGTLVDESALHGVLIKVRDLALPLLAMNRITDSRAELGTRAAIEKKCEGETPCYREH
jgi:hypothetical protein